MSTPKHRREPRLGIGRVIIDGSAHPSGGDTAFFQGDEATMLATPEMDGAVAAIGRLMEPFGGRVWLISKCGPRVQARTIGWLEGHDFYRRTALPPEHVRLSGLARTSGSTASNSPWPTSSTTVPTCTPLFAGS
jgi:hypothetical protein